MNQKIQLKKILKSYNFWAFIFYLIISLILLWPLVFSRGIPFKYDWFWTVYDLNDFKQSLLESNNGLLSIFSKNINLIFSFFGFLRLPPGFILRAFLIAVHTIAGYSFYLFCSRYSKTKIVPLIAGVFYAFTPYIFIRTIVGFMWSLSAYALTPVFLNLYFDPKKKVWKLVICGFMLTLIFAQPQAGVLLLLVLLINVILSQFTNDAKLRLVDFLMTMVFTFIFYLPWIIVYLYAGKNVSVVSGGEAVTLNFIAKLPHSLRNTIMLSDHLITTEYFYKLARNNIYIAGFGLILLISAAGFFNKKSRLLLGSFALASILMLPLSQGPSGYFVNLYTWLFNHFPLIGLFRETYHVEFLYAISLSLFFAFGLDWIWSKAGNHKLSANSKLRVKNKTVNHKLSVANILKIAIKILTATSALFIILPYFTFNYAGYLKNQEIPSAYHDLYNYLRQESGFCQKIYYPPSLGFIYFKNDSSPNALNADVLAQSMGVPYVTEGSSVLNLPSEEMFYRNELTSQFLEADDDGQFSKLLEEGGVDCMVVRSDLGTKYEQVSNLWRDPDPAIIKKWINPDVLSLARSKQGLFLDKQFGEHIYVFKITNHLSTSLETGNPQTLPSGRQITNKLQIQNTKLKAVGNSASQQFNNLTVQQLPITNWATRYDYYQDGWSRGRYAFWRKMLFAELRQDFLYTNKPESIISAKIEQRGTYELWIRYLTGGTPGNFKCQISNAEFDVQKDSGEEKFIWKNLGHINITDGNINITNIAGENAIADIVLIQK